METYNFSMCPVSERYYDENSCWGVYEFKTTNDIPYLKTNGNGEKRGVLAGNTQRLAIGTDYNAQARPEFNYKFKSYNYIPTFVTPIKPKTEEEQAAFLKTQVTPLQAENILKEYPNIIEDVINGAEIDFSRIKGVGEATWDKIKAKIEENYVMADILSLLQPLGVTNNVIAKLRAYESNPVLLKEKLYKNPYILTNVSGFGFKKTDDLAVKLNPEIKVSEYRVSAFVNWFLMNIGEETGDTWVYRIVLDNAVRDNINECYELYENYLSKQAVSEQKIIIRGDKVGLKWIYKSELKVLDMIKKLNEAKSDIIPDIERGILSAEKAQGFLYTDEQKEAIKKCCETNVVFITGQAGTGKSTILRGLVNIYGKYNIGCCALSAKAAQRIIEATGHGAGTIHRLLGYKFDGFEYNENNKLIYDVVVLDEASMVNVEIFKALLSAVAEGSKVIICGDDEQLPPIGSGNIFHDLLRMKQFNCCKLTKILRQAERSGIISDSRKIRQNEFPVKYSPSRIITGDLQDMTYIFKDNRSKMRDLAIKLYLKTVKECGLDDTIIITPCKQNRENSTKEINRIIQNELIPDAAGKVISGDKEFRTGAKVIQRVNNYDKGIFNGEIGYITNIERRYGKNFVTVKFNGDKEVELVQKDLSSLELAYALTVHVTQGSGYDNVIVIIDNTHYKLLDSCLLYTAVTRAKKKCLLIAEPSAFKRCINEKASVRKTWLSIENQNP